MIDNINARRLALTPRWAIAGLTKPQNVAEHSYYVVLYCMKLAETEKLVPTDKVMLYEAAVLHDFPEYLMSDIPGPVKRTIADRDKVKAMEAAIFEDNGVINPELFLSEKMVYILKLANLIDEWWTIKLDLLRGNSLIREFLGAIEDRIEYVIGSYPFKLETRMVVGNMMTMDAFEFSRIDKEHYDKTPQPTSDDDCPF